MFAEYLWQNVIIPVMVFAALAFVIIMSFVKFPTKDVTKKD